MGDIHTRPFSKNYSGLINQSVIAISITVLCVTAHEIMKRRRRGEHSAEDQLGSRESWEFGYLYQGRSWARFPSPPSPKGWPLSWVKQAVIFPEAKLHELRGIDAALYIRFLRGCFWFALLHTLTTFPILFPIHVRFSDVSISPKSMTRASISSLVSTKTGLSLLWIHICLLFWITLSWMATLLWICNGAFKLRSAELDTIRQSCSTDDEDAVYYPHPHPQFNFTEIIEPDRNHPNKGFRCRTVMVSNVPQNLRNEKALKEYFEYYMSRKVEKPSMGLTSSTQPGFLNKWFAFLLNRAKRLPVSYSASSSHSDHEESPPPTIVGRDSSDNSKLPPKPLIERVTIARKMTELASLLERREEILRLLETAHIKLANKTVLAVKDAMERQSAKKPLAHSESKAMSIARRRRSIALDLENGMQEETLDEETRMEQLIEVVGPFVKKLGPQASLAVRSKKAISRTSQKALSNLWTQESPEPEHPHDHSDSKYPPRRRMRYSDSRATIWDALLSLPRSSLDAYQPLINLEHVFRGQVVPSIDYYTTKLNLLTTLITEERSKPPTSFEAVSTAFVTFADPADARRACKYLAVHPNNPLACLVTFAPMYSDLDWIRVMKSSFNAEFVKDWVVNLGVWAFTIFWLFPVSLLVGLVSIQNISEFWPSLKNYLQHHPWQSEVLQSFLPTLLVALLALLIPLILLLIAKKAHTITTLSALHDRIMTRYYKFLIVNVLVFFCVGTAAMQSVLRSSQSATDRLDVIQIVADSFPTAGPFYVGWLIFTTAIHGAFELALFGLPLLVYPNTRRQVVPRKRAVGTRPRTFNFYYWLPNHMLVIHVLLLFSVLNPFVLPFGVLYFFVQCGVVKNQLIHVYAKHYEGNGQLILIRILRYSLDGLILTQAVFLAYMVVLKKSASVGLSAFLITFTATVKVILTRMCRAQFEKQDILEADLLCGKQHTQEPNVDDDATSNEELARTVPSGQHQHGDDKLIHHHDHDHDHDHPQSRVLSSIRTWKLPDWINFSYSSARKRTHQPQRRPTIPFRAYENSFSRLRSMSIDRQVAHHSTGSETGGFSPRSEIHSTERVNRPRKSRSHSLHLNEKPVVPHLSPMIWDDQKNPDLPYDNPFYSRAIDNILWLPRNPCGLLDLDDTVDMKTSLTVEVAAGQLGTFPIGLLERVSPGEMSQISSRPRTTSSETVGSPPPFSRELQEVDGTEEIELPATIAKRVQAGEADVEHIAKPRKISGARGKFTNAARSATMPAVGRRPSSLAPSSPSLLSADGSGRGRGRERSHSIMSTLQLPFSLQRTNFPELEKSSDELPSPPNAFPFPFGASGSRTSLSQQGSPVIRPSRSQNLSASNAIFREVLAEEEDAKRDHILEEQTEATKSQNNKSWWTSWMFKKWQ